METQRYFQLALQEQLNWYKTACRAAIKYLVNTYISPQNRKLFILDVGSGTGGTTYFLTQFGITTGLESSKIAISLSNKNYPDLKIIETEIENTGDKIKNNEFDLVTVLNVLYHKNIREPQQAIAELSMKLKKNGWLIWLEPAYPFLRRQMDDFGHGVRRFYPSQMNEFLNRNGFRVRFKTHLCLWAFPIALISAAFYRLKMSRHFSADLKTPNKYLNTLFYYITLLEWKISTHIFRMPIGVSYIILAQKI